MMATGGGGAVGRRPGVDRRDDAADKLPKVVHARPEAQQDRGPEVVLPKGRKAPQPS